ncbi:MAG: hypothetical protein AB7S38_12200 [Vulcanimicrobiota bacterium]
MGNHQAVGFRRVEAAGVVVVRTKVRGLPVMERAGDADEVDV